MGRPAARQGDQQSGHECYPPTMCIRGSSNVKTNGRQAMIMGSMFMPHACPLTSPHPVSSGMGSTKVLINKRPANRLGDMMMCSFMARVMMGSSNVLIG